MNNGQFEEETTLETKPTLPALAPLPVLETEEESVILPTLPELPTLPTIPTKPEEPECKESKILIPEDSEDMTITPQLQAANCKKHKTRGECIDAANRLNISRMNEATDTITQPKDIFSRSECAFERLKMFTIMLRRGHSSYWNGFISFLGENLDEICKTSSIRWLASILDSFVDYGDDKESRNALLAISWVVSEKNRLVLNEHSVCNLDIDGDKEKHSGSLPQAVKEYKSKMYLAGPITRKEWEMYDWNDYIRNYFMRMNRLQKETPIVEKIYKAILTKMQECEASSFRQLNEVFKYCKPNNKVIFSPLEYTKIIDMPRIFCREEFADMIRIYGYKVGIELGVAAGKFSKILLERSPLEKLYCIDKWNDHHNEKEMESVVKNFERFGQRVKIIHSTFENALSSFQDGSIDFIYIDGYAHGGQENGKTLEDWYPKLREGGMFCGHDYSDEWPLTKKAVDEFALKTRKPFYTTSSDRFPSWYFIK